MLLGTVNALQCTKQTKQTKKLNKEILGYSFTTSSVWKTLTLCFCFFVEEFGVINYLLYLCRPNKRLWRNWQTR